MTEGATPPMTPPPLRHRPARWIANARAALASSASLHDAEVSDPGSPSDGGLDVERLARALAIESGWIEKDWTDSSEVAREVWRGKARRIIARLSGSPSESEG